MMQMSGFSAYPTQLLHQKPVKLNHSRNSDTGRPESVDGTRKNTLEPQSDLLVSVKSLAFI